MDLGAPAAKAYSDSAVANSMAVMLDNGTNGPTVRSRRSARIRRGP
jgi:hypothetical protein